ncbi:peptide chain release factor 2 [bacterium]|nr:peptide chain release factor 2 [bacterium]
MSGEGIAEQVDGLKAAMVRVLDACRPLDWAARVSALEGELARPETWENRPLSVRLQKEAAALRRQLDRIAEAEGLLAELHDDLELAAMESEEGHLAETAGRAKRLAGLLGALEVEAMFTDKDDAAPAILTIQAGAGGVDAQDWAAMLLRMYLRWADGAGFKAEEIDRTDGTEAGILSATVVVDGLHATGWLRAERGVHRLVRLSPYDSASRRHTSFAHVEVTPKAEEADDLEIPEDDVRMEFFRAGGPGGQHANKTSSAVRLVHLPTGISVTCRNERSQHQNRALAQTLLKSRLLALRRAEEEGERKKGERVEIAWGNQVRSYILHPYQMVKDLRSGYETGRVEAVLDGDLAAIMRSVLTLPADG